MSFAVSPSSAALGVRASVVRAGGAAAPVVRAAASQVRKRAYVARYLTVYIVSHPASRPFPPGLDVTVTAVARAHVERS